MEKIKKLHKGCVVATVVKGIFGLIGGPKGGLTIGPIGGIGRTGGVGWAIAPIGGIGQTGGVGLADGGT